jgi:hypothetical protein
MFLKKSTTLPAAQYELPPTGFVRLGDFVGKGKVIPVSKSTWYAWAKAGRAIRPTRLGPRTSAYPVEAVVAFIASFEEK